MILRRVPVAQFGALVLAACAALLARTQEESGTLTDPYGLVRGLCSYPCQCQQDRSTLCPLTLDGCGCCYVCARQLGQSCDVVNLCDHTLECVFATPISTTGICKERNGHGCQVPGAGGRWYGDGESFKLDCRTQCTCQNGTYGCVSLCPDENVRPSGKCRNPKLVMNHGACCRDWLCESDHVYKEMSCARYSTPWSPCSKSCNTGISYRITNDNKECAIRNETRICKVRSCNPTEESSTKQWRSLRRRHVCRATVRSPVPARLDDGQNCTSLKSFQARFCAECEGRVCSPSLATTIKVPFRCPNRQTVKDVMWIVKCTCA